MKKKTKLYSTVFTIAMFILSAWFVINLLVDIKNGSEWRQIQEIEPLNLSTEQKLEDFEFFYNTVVDSIPMIDCYEEVYGFSFKSRKNIYWQAIENTTNDYEFYCVMDAIGNEIPSAHTDVIDPYVNNYRSLHGYNELTETSEGDIYSTCNYWDRCYYDGFEHYLMESTYAFEYIDGKYLFINAKFNQVELNPGCIIEKINGVDIDEFITKQLMSYPLMYDGKNNKPYRALIGFNDNIGEPLMLSISDTDGNQRLVQLCYDLYLEEAVSYSGDIKIQKENTTDETKTETPDNAEMNVFKDDNNSVVDNICKIYEGDDFSYVVLNDMSSYYGRDIKARLSEIKSNNIILDLRGCTGGNQDFCEKYLYPCLFNQSFDEEKIWYMPESSTNEYVYDQFWNRLLEDYCETDLCPYTGHENYLSSTISKGYEGGSFVTKKIVLLTSANTCSAADEFVSVIKNHKLATVIGNNTGGEGLESSYISLVCPNSLLAFMYMPGGAKNPDGTDNSVYGTAPDIYVTQTVDDFMLGMETGILPVNDENWDTIFSYDSVLRYGVNYLLGDM